MAKYSIVLDIEEGKRADGTDRSTEQMVKYLQLTIQQALTRSDSLIKSVTVKEHKAGAGGTRSVPGAAGGVRGRKPVNRPKIENWIRKNVTAGPSTQGTTGLNGVDRQGKPLIDSPNRVYPHRLAAPEPDGVGLSLLAIDKVLKELEVEGYLERGFASGSPFYELIRPLEDEGQVGVRGRPLDEVPVGATPRELKLKKRKDS